MCNNVFYTLPMKIISKYFAEINNCCGASKCEPQIINQINKQIGEHDCQFY